jgi:hypothetical protein
MSFRFSLSLSGQLLAQAFVVTAAPAVLIFGNSAALERPAAAKAAPQRQTCEPQVSRN